MINLDVGGKWRGLEFTGSVRGKRWTKSQPRVPTSNMDQPTARPSAGEE
jgi:hypothetical protein